MPNMRKGCWFGPLAALTLASALWGRQAVVHLKDGTQLSGDVEASGDANVEIVIDGVHETVPRHDVDWIEYGDVDDLFRGRMSRLAARDVAGRLAIARWAADQGRYNLARRATAEALAIDPNSAEALEFMQTINYQADLALSEHRPLPTTEPVPAIQVIRPVSDHYLSMDQVNQIRQLELRPSDQVRIEFTGSVRARFIASSHIDPEKFYSLTLTDQARLILQKGEADMAKDVLVRTDPAALAEFRNRMEPMVLGGCAISGCHNARDAAGGFGLFTGDDSPQACYSNFYILQTYTKRLASRDGEVDQRLMIDRNYPDRSLLAEYSLPAVEGDPPHPPVKNLHFLFERRNDIHYQSMIHWIGYMLKPEGGNFPGIDYRPPWQGPIHPLEATTAPTTR